MPKKNSKVPSKASSKAPRKKSSPFFVLMVLVTIIAGLWWIVDGQKAPTAPTAGSHKYKVIKTGAGVTIDFSEASRDLDTVVTKMVKNSGFKSSISERSVREVPRTQIEGTIKWETRRITLAVPRGSRTTNFEEELGRIVTKNGGKIFEAVADTVEGSPALRLRIGIEDVLEGDTVTIVTHTLWLITAADKPITPPSEDIQTGYTQIPKQSSAKQGAVTKEPVGKETTPAKPSPAVKEKGRLALVIDDFGLTMEGVVDLMALEQPLTFAIIPYHPYSAAIARQASAQGKQVILHLPMESIGGEKAEPTTILTTMSDEQIKTRTREALAAVPQVIGVNNHQGSKATADARVMKAVLSLLRERNLFFIDSRTNAASVATETAKGMSVKTAENDHFIDNSSDIETIKQELRVAGKLAIQQGEAIAIGHIRPNTVIAIRAMIPELEAMGVRLVFASQMVR